MPASFQNSPQVHRSCADVFPVTTLATILEGLDELPTTPQILPQLQSLLRDPNTDQSDVVAFLRMDGGLTARIIRLANSPMFLVGARVENLSDAISRLGFNDVFRLVAAAISQEVLSQRLDAYHLKAGELARDSLACAFVMEALPVFPNDAKDRETRFTVGLFHSIGKVAINRYFIDRGLEVYNPDDGGEVTPEQERMALGFDHGEAGAEILQRWRFSERMARCLRHQFDPFAHAPSALPAQLAIAKRAVPLVWSEEAPEDMTASLGIEPALLTQAGFEAGALNVALEWAHTAFSNIRPVLSIG